MLEECGVIVHCESCPEDTLSIHRYADEIVVQINEFDCDEYVTTQTVLTRETAKQVVEKLNQFIGEEV